MKSKFISLLFEGGVLLLGLQINAWAGQFITEDVEITEYKHTELTPFSNMTKIKKWTEVEVPALEMNMGVLPDLQLHLITPIVLYSPRKGSTQYGYGDIESGVKYRFVQETDEIPGVAFFPKVLLPAGDVNLGLGQGGPSESFPLWIEKHWDPWTISGGGGYSLSQAPETASYGFGGILLQREITKKLTLGGEFYGQGKTDTDVHSTLIFTLGGAYNFVPDISLFFSAGHSLAGQKIVMGYIGLDFVLGPS